MEKGALVPEARVISWPRAVMGAGRAGAVKLVAGSSRLRAQATQPAPKVGALTSTTGDWVRGAVEGASPERLASETST
jgi:hypothetical protein